jgi:site-specific recombinase XerD
VAIHLFSPLAGYKSHLESQGLRPRTIATYLWCLGRILNHLSEQGFSKPSDLQQEAVGSLEHWMMEAAFAPNTRGGFIRAFKSFTSYLTDQGELLFDPGQALKAPKSHHKIKKFPSVSQIKTLIDSINPDKFQGLRDRLLVGLLYFTGMRISEAVAVKLNDIDLGQRKALIQGKGGHERYVYFPASVLKDLNSHLQKRPHPHPLIFDGICATVAGRTVTKICRKIDFPWTGAHFLRYSIATHLFQKGVNPRLIQVMLGHKSLKSTFEYIHPDLDFLKDIHSQFHPCQHGFL